MSNKINGLSESLKEFQNQIQKNYDAIDEVLEKRERIRTLPANKADVCKRMEDVIVSMSDRFMDEHKHDIQRLTGYKDFDEINLFTINKKIGEYTVAVLDPDAFVFFNKELLIAGAKKLSAEVSLPNAGLPFDDRAKEISALDEEISRLEDQKKSLHKQATDAGLTIAEEYESF